MEETQMKYLQSKKKNRIKFFLIFFLFCAFSYSQKKIIVIDPGHGGFDKGAIGYNGVLEKDIVLNISKTIDSLNDALFEKKIKIYLTRYKDTFVSLGSRTSFTKKVKADYFISIHCNQLPNHSKTKGLEVYVQNPLKKYPVNNIKSSINLALNVTGEISKNLKIRNRGILFNNFQVLRQTISYIPSILVETAYISNKIEADYFKEQKNIRAISLAILNAIYITIKEDNNG